MNVTRHLAFVVTFFAGLNLFGQQTSAVADSQVNQILDQYVHLHVAVTRSPAEANEAAAIVGQLNGIQHQVAVKAVLGRITESTDGKEIGKYMWLLANLAPSAKDDLISAIAHEANATKKSKLVGVLKEFKGADVIRVLVDQLEDTRPGEINGATGPHTLRICDYAFDDLYVRLRHIAGLELNSGSDMGDLIVHGVPVASRDERIAKLKSALLAKYGSELRVDE